MFQKALQNEITVIDVHSSFQLELKQAFVARYCG
jgi:hypothetical protein